MVELNIKQLCILAILIFIIYHLSANQYNGFSVGGKVKNFNNFKNYLPYCNDSLYYGQNSAHTIEKGNCSYINTVNGDCRNPSSQFMLYEIDGDTGYLCGEIFDTSRNIKARQNYFSHHEYDTKCNILKEAPVCNNNCYSLFDNTMTEENPMGCFQNNPSLCKDCLSDYLKDNNPDNLDCDDEKIENWCLQKERV